MYWLTAARLSPFASIYNVPFHKFHRILVELITSSLVFRRSGTFGLGPRASALFYNFVVRSSTLLTRSYGLDRLVRMILNSDPMVGTGRTVSPSSRMSPSRAGRADGTASIRGLGELVLRFYVLGYHCN